MGRSVVVRVDSSLSGLLAGGEKYWRSDGSGLLLTTKSSVAFAVIVCSFFFFRGFCFFIDLIGGGGGHALELIIYSNC